MPEPAKAAPAAPPAPLLPPFAAPVPTSDEHAAVATIVTTLNEIKIRAPPRAALSYRFIFGAA
jgi:hypothetical protein